MSLDIDYYELLECERTADDATLKSSYRKLAMKYHPDKNPGCHDSEARFKAISEAYDCLRDPQKRAAYDRFGKDGVRGGGGAGRRGRFRRHRRYFRIDLRLGVRRRAAATRPRARRRPALRHGNPPRGRLHRHHARDSGRCRGALRRVRRIGRQARHRRPAAARPAPATARSARSRVSSWSSAPARPVRARARSSPIRATAATAKAASTGARR